MQDLFLGIDFGTGGCKVTAVSESGGVVADASVEYPTEYPHSGWSEQNPSDWYAAMCKAIAEVEKKGADLSKVAAISFDGSTHNAVLLDYNVDRPAQRQGVRRAQARNVRRDFLHGLSNADSNLDASANDVAEE